MAMIQITPETLRSQAQTVRGYAEEHTQIIAKLSSLVQGLGESWKGEAQQAFVAKYDSMKPTFDKLAQDIETYAKGMETAATTMEEADKSSASQFA